MDKRAFTSASAYPVKLLRHSIISLMTKQKMIFPFHVQLNPTNKCNLKCEFCSCANKDDHEMPIEQAATILSTYYKMGMGALTISGGGDPMCYPWINDLIRLCNNLRVEVGLVTNGVLLHLLDKNLDLKWCRISVDGRHLLTREAIQKIIDMPHVDWAMSYVLRPHDYSNLTRAVLIANELNMTHIRVVDDILSKEESKINHARSIIESHGIGSSKIIWQGRKDSTPGCKECRIGLIKPNIDAHGDVYPCCIEENERVLIKRDGVELSVSIKDVLVGDICPSEEGDGIILNKLSKESDQIEVVVDNSRSVIVSPDHTMLVFKDNKFVEKKASEVIMGDLMGVRVKSVDSVDSSPKVINNDYTKALYWLLGLYTADGWDSKYNTIGISPGKSNIWIEDLNKKLKLLSLDYRVYERETTLQYDINVNELKSVFILCGYKAINKCIPDMVMSAHRELKMEFLKGYLKDGSIYTDKRYRMVFSTISRILSSDLTLFLSKLGLEAKPHKARGGGTMVIEGRTVNTHDLYRINVHGGYQLIKVQEVFEYLGKEVRLGKKGPKPKDNIGSIKILPVTSIKNLSKKGMMYDLYVSNTNKFFAGNGMIMVHNCGVQYSRSIPDLNFNKEFSLGNDYEGIVERQIVFDGTKCDVCYYCQYNAMLGSILEAQDIEHGKFI